MRLNGGAGFTAVAIVGGARIYSVEENVVEEEEKVVARVPFIVNVKC